jgi:hemin uptake protein HemP
MHSRDLFGNADQVVLIHEGQYYRLRRTRNGKLILNK